MTVRVLSDQSVNIGLLVRVLNFGPCFVLWSVVLWWSVTSPCFVNHLEVPPRISSKSTLPKSAGT